MVRIAINGCNGRMGQAISSLILNDSEGQYGCSIAYGIDVADTVSNPYPVFKSISEVPSDLDVDCIIDFSHYSVVRAIIEFAISRATPIVVATTGITPEDKLFMKEAATKIPLFYAANYSIGICVLKDLVRRASLLLGDSFDVEIVEKHHNKKLDAPSGTALALADAVNAVNDEKYEYIYDRHSRSAKREKSEIGISSVRGGNIIGDHDVIFAGENEVIEISHKAMSRSVFANGAIRAAAFLADKPIGSYDMESMLQ